jgi:hypothetical protein
VGWLFAYLWGSSISGLSCCCQGLALGYLSGSLWARPWGYFSGPYVRVPCEYYLGDSLWVVTSISYSGAAYSLLVIILSCRLFVDSYTGIYFSTTKSRRNPHHFVPTTLLFRGLLVSSCCYSWAAYSFACDYSLLLLFEVLNKLPPPAVTYRCHLPYTYRCLGAHPPTHTYIL